MKRPKLPESEFAWKVGDKVRIYETAARAVIEKREARHDPRYNEIADAYLVKFLDGSSGWFFGRQLEVAP